MANRAILVCCTVCGEGVDRLTLSLSSEDKAALTKIADQKQASIAWVIRDAITLYLSKKSELCPPDNADWSHLQSSPKQLTIGKEQADTYRHVQHPALLASYVLANPRFSDSDWFRKDADVRWQFGVPPKGNANLAWGSTSFTTTPHENLKNHRRKLPLDPPCQD